MYELKYIDADQYAKMFTFKNYITPKCIKGRCSAAFGKKTNVKQYLNAYKYMLH